MSENFESTPETELSQEFLNAAMSKKEKNVYRPGGRAYTAFADGMLGFARAVSLIFAFISLPLGFIIGVCAALQSRKAGLIMFAICLVSGFLNSAFNYALYVVFARVQDHLGRRLS